MWQLAPILILFKTQARQVQRAQFTELTQSIYNVQLLNALKAPFNSALKVGRQFEWARQIFKETFKYVN